VRSYDLIVIGAGSGNMLFGPELDGLRSAIIEPDRFGGTCLNRGCIPSKMFVVAADIARSVMEAKRLGVHAALHGVDWPAIRERIFGRIDPIHDRSVEDRRRSGVDVYTAPARFVAPKVLEVAGEHLSAEQIVIAAGSRPVVPPIPGLDAVEYHTSDTIMRVERVPPSLVIVGGGFIAAEMSHVFGAFGAQVTIVQRGPRLLMAEDEAVSARFTELAAQRFEVLLDSEVVSVEARGNEIAVTVAGASQVLEAETLLIATGRQPNTDLLDAVTGGLALDDHGHLVTDTAYRTSVPGVWALGDATHHFQLKHLANAEMRVVRHNLVHPDDPRRLPAGVVPHAVFSEPPVAGVGLTEQEARRSAIDHVVSVRPYSDTAYGWALEDTTSFVKLIADPHRRTLLGAHIIGPHAPILLQPLLQGMMLGQTVDQLGRDVLYVHPALTEVIEQALLDL
jgi:mycothione reductase